MKDRIIRLAAIATLLIGIAFVSYPFVSNAIIRAAQEKVAEDNIMTVVSADDGRLDEEKAAADAYNAALHGSMVVATDPFDPSRNTDALSGYDSTLDIAGDGVMGSIEIPEIGVFVPLYHGTSDEVLSKGAGHLQQTSLPVGGPSTHCVAAGHTGLPSVRIFDSLDRLHEGSLIIVNVLGKRLGYEVYEVEIVEPEETDSLAIVEGRDLLTLVTCTPYGINSHRLLVHAERCVLPAEIVEAPAGRISEEPHQCKILVAIVIVTGLALIVCGLAARRRRRRRAAAPANGGRSLRG